MLPGVQYHTVILYNIYIYIYIILYVQNMMITFDVFLLLFIIIFTIRHRVYSKIGPMTMMMDHSGDDVVTVLVEC